MQKTFSNDQLLDLTGYSAPNINYLRRVGVLNPAGIGKKLLWNSENLYLAKVIKLLEVEISKQKVIDLIKEIILSFSDREAPLSDLWINPYLIFSFLEDDGIMVNFVDAELAVEYGLQAKVGEKNLSLRGRLVLYKNLQFVARIDNAYILATAKIKEELDEAIKELNLLKKEVNLK